ncbi:MAG: DNA mismatch repair endonuclease MutL [Ruminococcus sp.]|nr:DNA mismatch repair endonuclease MutL [Ruminococcus sp.]
MAVINVLSKEISELIAAGEVIERPASVIKELVENSIDAGARHITVEIKNGGTIFMRITDDGCGISCEDVATAFLRHATSKINVKNDLDNICTLGFRGEALASVAAVAKVELMTKRKEDEYGTCYHIEGSVEKSCEQSGCPDGTTIIIRDLFYNVPVRRKFMKKDVTEANAVSQIMQKIALSHPEISFKLIRDNRMEFNTGGDGELYSAIYSVFGRDFARDLIEVDYDYEGIKVEGYVIKPLYAKSNRTFQNFFVNKRYVKSKLCSSALENAYENMLMTGKFPACVLMLDVIPSEIDVNIHPAKAEIRFTNEKKITDAIYFATKNALMNNGLIYEFQMKNRVDWTSMRVEEPQEEFVQQEMIFTPVEKIEEEEIKIEIHDREIAEKESEPKFETISERCSAIEKAEKETATQQAEAFAPVNEESKSDVAVENLNEYKYIKTASFSKVAEQIAEPLQKPQPEKSKLRVIGEAFKNYIMAEVDDSVIMIDKHAAHERIIFERLKSQNCTQYRQMLMTERKTLLSSVEFDALVSNQERLAQMGFSFDFSQSPYVITTAIPVFFKELDLDEVIPEIAENLVMGKQNPQTHTFDDILHTLACKSAIKANDKNDIRELQSLAEQVYFDENIRHCPHGRPVMFTLTKGNIERQFKRT